MRFLVAAAVLVATAAFMSCGKKSSSDSSSASETPIGSLVLTCGGNACIGTDGK